MDFLLEALDDIAGEVFASIAHLLNLDLDIVFVDATSRRAAIGLTAGWLSPARAG